MSDKEFCARRVQEQDDYMYDLHVKLYNNEISYERYLELGESAVHQRFRFIYKPSYIIPYVKLTP